MESRFWVKKLNGVEMTSCFTGFAANSEDSWRRTTAALQGDSARKDAKRPYLEANFDWEFVKEVEGGR